MKNGWYKTETSKLHYVDNYLHRLDGPAFISNDGHKEWWINGWYVDVESQEEFENSVEFRSFKLKAFW